ncbi:MAG: hypothetical protein DRO39_09490 [Thermoprotei archaeon]|nr:MAG: hypothetical protein DRO39_09490 [Thermoprotei archaeon]
MVKFKLDKKSFEAVVDVINTFDSRYFRHRFPGEFVRTGRNVWFKARTEWMSRRDLVVNYLMRSFVAQNAVLGMCSEEPAPVADVAKSMALIMASVEGKYEYRPYMLKSARKLISRLEKAGAVKVEGDRVMLEIEDPMYFQERCIYSHMDHPLGLHAVRRMLTLCTVTVRDEVMRSSLPTIALDYHNLKSVGVDRRFIERITGEYLERGYLSESGNVLMETHKKVIGERYAKAIREVCPELSERYPKAIRRLLSLVGIVSLPVLRSLIYSDTSIDERFGASADMVRYRLMEAVEVCTRKLVREGMLAKEGSLVIPDDVVKALRLFEPEATMPVHTTTVERILYHVAPNFGTSSNPLSMLVSYVQTVRSLLASIHEGARSLRELLGGRSGYERAVAALVLPDLEDMGYITIGPDGTINVNENYFRPLAKLLMAIPPYV